jgi:hypothetical protein
MSANPSPADQRYSLRAGASAKIYARPGFDPRRFGFGDDCHTLPRLVAVSGSSLSPHSQWNTKSCPCAVFEKARPSAIHWRSLYALMILEAQVNLFAGHQLKLLPLVRVHAPGSWITIARLHSPTLSILDIASSADLLWSSLHERTATVSGWRTGADSRLTVFGSERVSPSIHLDRPRRTEQSQLPLRHRLPFVMNNFDFHDRDQGRP